MREVVPDLTAFGPMAELFPEQQIIETGRADEVKHLFEQAGNQFRVHTVEHQYLEESFE